MRRRSGLIALAGIGCARFARTGWAGEEADRGLHDAIAAAMRPVVARHDVPGLAVAVTAGGRATFFHHGVASRETGAPVTPGTLFEIGSVSKTFTATLAAYAQALGALSLDDHPGKYVPQLAGRAIDRATLRDLGTFTAGGLPLQFPDDVTDDAAMIRYFRDWTPQAAPGTKRRYSNPSIALLGHVTAIALRRDFADAVENALLPALGLGDTFIHVPAAALPRYAWGYARENRPIRVNPGSGDAQAYGMKSTAADMIRFVQANIEPGRLPAPLQRAIAGTHRGFVRVGGMVQGLGWEQYAWPVTLDRLLAGNSSAMIMDARAVEQLPAATAPSAPTLYNKTGSTNGFSAYAAFVPHKKIGLVMLANRNVPIPARIEAAHAILAHLDGS